MQTLTLIEATGIQEYVFGSNQLAQNLGASELVRLATIDWVREALQETCPGGHNFAGLDDSNLPVIQDRDLLQDGLDAEVVYVGGGNAMLIFGEEARARAFARVLSRRVLSEAPGLRLALIHEQVALGKGLLAAAHQQAREHLARRKLDVQPSTAQLGLGVTAACVYTGEPAVADDDGQLISAQVVAKRQARQHADRRMHAMLPQIRGAGLDFVYDFNDLGTRQESSYLAIVHTDGNRMGQRIQDLGQRHQGDDRGYIRALRAFSSSVQTAAAHALHSTVDRLLSRFNPRTNEIADLVPVNRRRLPFQPIIFGGDDVTFVTEGRLGLSLAAIYLREFSGQLLSDQDYAHARAGVAVVKSHYPFSRAYDLAEALCASAKAFIKERDPDRRRTALDWHFAVSGFTRSLAEIRRREYAVRAGSLLMRPLQMDTITDTWRTWDQFVEIAGAFQDPKGDWAVRRNKVKALRDALRDGPEAVQHFLAMHRDTKALPEIPALPDMKDRGWQGKWCGYFDAVEALDFFVDL